MTSFSIQVEYSNGEIDWEHIEREEGPGKTIRGHGQQPHFNGDINQYGKDLIKWFNKDEKPSNHRRFIKAEMGNQEHRNKKS